MKTPPRLLPTWLEWVCWIGGGLFLCGHSFGLFYSVPMAWIGTQVLREKPPKGAMEILYAFLLVYAPLLVNLIGLWIGYIVVRVPGKRRKKVAAHFDSPGEPAPDPSPVRVPTSAPAARLQSGKRWGSCNVLLPGAQIRHLWQFNTGGNKFNLLKSESKLPSEPLPEKLVGKDWNTVFQPRLNIAWLPAEKVFLRVVQLPKADAGETQSMIELQLEKISPLPVNQVVWSYEVFPYIARGGATDHLNPHAAGEQQTVVVIMVARNHVEEFLGQLESQGYVADRLELPLLDELRSTLVRENGAWVFPGIGGHPGVCMVAWWYEGVLQNLTLLNIPAGEARAPALREQIAQTAWAGEMEGWLTTEPRFHLVGDEATAAEWQPHFDPNATVEIVPPHAPQALAAMTARRVTTTAATTNLLPPEYAKRYRQQFVDRLWMRSLGAALLLYIFGVVIYIGFVQVASYRLDSTQTEARGLSIQYTNSLQLKEKLRVLQETLELQYAALECYKAVADTMPAELTLDWINFDRGREVTFRGFADAGDRSKVIEFNEALLKVQYNDQPLFSKVSMGRMDTKLVGGGLTWILVGSLKRSDITE
jgi:hypothetical protein